MTDRSVLDRLSIASPCAADWNQMHGDERRRFCGQCRLHVHDLSRMSSDEAIALLREAGQGRLCVRFYRRADGKVLTRDCPVGLRQRLRWAIARAVALWCVVCSGLAACVRPAKSTPAGPPPQTEPVPVLQGEVWMGDVVAPTPTDAPPEMGGIRLEPK